MLLFDWQVQELRGEQIHCWLFVKIIGKEEGKERNPYRISEEKGCKVDENSDIGFLHNGLQFFGMTTLLIAVLNWYLMRYTDDEMQKNLNFKSTN